MKRFTLVILVFVSLAFILNTSCQDKKALAQLEEQKAEFEKSEKNKAIAERWHSDLGIDRKWELADEILAPDIVLHLPGMEDIKGIDGAKSLDEIYANMKNAKINHYEIVAEGELINLSEEASRDILDEIMSHRQIRAAENGDLQIKIESINSIEILNSSIGRISSHEVGQNKQILIAGNSANVDFETDRMLFQRVIINLLKNALEATHKAGTVVAGAEDMENKIRFWVKNDEIIPIDVQLQLFQRSFSTKGQSRGIGTYSIKLLTENYLKGIVSFISSGTVGTVFSIELNKVFPVH